MSRSTSVPNLHSLARGDLARRLDDVRRRVIDAAPDDISAITEALRDLQDRVATWELTAALDNQHDAADLDAPGGPSALHMPRASGDASAPHSRLVSTMLTASRTPVTEFLLIPFGEVSVERPVAGGDFVFTRRHAESALRWFTRIGRTLAIDYEHQSFDRLNARRDGLNPAAGWIGGLEIRPDGLWAVNVTWTDRARQLLASGEYRYFSPVIYWTDTDQTDLAGLGPVALTNDPAMHGVQPLAAKCAGEANMGAAAVATDAPPPDADADSDDTGDECRAAARDEDLLTAARDHEPLAAARDRELHAAARDRDALAAAREEIALLRRRLACQEAEAFVERGLRLGKIADSTSMDWREEYLRDPARAEARLARAPVLWPPGRIIGVDAAGRVQPDEFEDAGPLPDVLRRWGIEPADLAAYHRAARAGRVRHVGMANGE